MIPFWSRNFKTRQSGSSSGITGADVVFALMSFGFMAVAAVKGAPKLGSAPYLISITGAGNSHSPVFSADGRHVAFVSHANNLVTNDDLAPHLDLFVRDLVTSNTVLVSVSAGGVGGANDNVVLYTLSSNAQFIAFETAANNLAPGDTNRFADIYVRDLIAGTTRLVSVNTGGVGSGNGSSSNPLVSEDGRYVVFESLASNLVTNDFNGTNDIFIHDLTTGVTELVSVNAEGTASASGLSHSPSISADGLTVAFVSHATNLVEGVTNTLGEVYARKVAEGATRWAVASHIPWATRQNYSYSFPWRWPGPFPPPPPTVPYAASGPVLSRDGRYVAFKTLKSSVRFDLHSETNEISIAFPTENLNETNYFTFLVNPRVAVDSCETPLAFTKDGRFLLVNNTNRNAILPAGIGYADFDTLITNYNGYCWPSYLDCRYRGNETNVSHLLSSVLTNTSVGETYARWTKMPWLHVDLDASRILFVTDATALVSGITNRTFQLYSLSLSNGTISLLSTNPAGKPLGSLDGTSIAATSDGSLIAFESPDDSLVPDDLNRAWDVFVRNVDTGETKLISMRHPDLPAASGIALSRLDLNPGAISADGRRIAVLSLDNTLAQNDTNNWRDLVVRDLVTATNIDVSRSIVPFSPYGQTNYPGSNTAVAPFLSADGRFVAFVGETSFGAEGTNRTIYWRDSQSSSNRVVVSGSSFSYPAVSSNGRLLAFHSTELREWYYQGIGLMQMPDNNGQPDVFVFKTANVRSQDAPGGGATQIIRGNPMTASTIPDDTSTGSAASVNPAFSPDVSVIAFQSRATNLTTDVISGENHQLFVRSIRLTDTYIPPDPTPSNTLSFGPAMLISYNTAASAALNGKSVEVPLAGGAANPRFSSDSRYVAFEAGGDLIYRHNLLGGWVTNITPHPEGSITFYFTNRARMTNDLVCTGCRNPTLSGDGRFVAYQSGATAVPTTSVFVKDVATGQEELISVGLTVGTGGNAASFNPLLSHDARYVVFVSKASDLVPNDTNRVADIFVRDRFAGATHCLSQNWLGTDTGNRVSSNPVLAANGRTVAFQSFASDLLPGDYNDTRDVFVVTLGGPDTDADGMDDDWEMTYFSTISRDGTGDFDNDGASDLDEFRAGTNPANDSSILRVIRITSKAIAPAPFNYQQTAVLWSAAPGKTYRVQFNDDVGAPWNDLQGNVTAGGTSASIIHTDFSAPTHRFYRVLLVQ